jgi:hypothetical protein
MRLLVVAAAGVVMDASGGLIAGVTALGLRTERHAQSRPR